MKKKTNNSKPKQIGFVINKKKSSMWVKNRDIVHKFQVVIQTAVSEFMALNGLYPDTIRITYQRNSDNGRVLVGADILMR